MAKTKTKGLQYPKPKASFFLCCFGSVQNKTPKDNPPKQNIRTSKKSMAKTVPLQEGLEFPDMKSYTKLHSSSWKWRSKSKSMLMSKSKPLSNTQINSTLGQPLSQSQSPKRGNKPEYDTRQHAVSLPRSKRQHVVHETTGKDWKHKQKQKHQQDHVIGACMFIISLVSVIVLGRLGSIFCTTSFLYLIPAFAKRQRQFRRRCFKRQQSHPKMSRFCSRY